MRNSIESGYVERIDRKRSKNELRGQGRPGEELVLKFNEQILALESRFSTEEEDKGPESGGRQTIDLVSYREGKPALAAQITTDVEKGVIKKKLEEIKDHPFIRLEEMGSADIAIPKVLVYLDARQVSNFSKDPNFEKHPELALQILDSYIRSLKFDLSRTQNPLEQKAVNELIEMFDSERKKYIH